MGGLWVPPELTFGPGSACRALPGPGLLLASSPAAQSNLPGARRQKAELWQPLWAFG